MTDDIPDFMQAELFAMEELAGKSPHQIRREKEAAYQQQLIDQMDSLPPLRGYPVKGKPLLHQQRALREADMAPGHAHWMDPGAGKTFVNIAELGLRWKQGEINGAVILAPNGPHLQWIDEQFPKWADYPWEGISNRMTKIQLGKAIKNMEYVGRDNFNVLVMNHDAVKFKSGQDLVNAFRNACGKRIALIDDESQKKKNWEAARTQATMQIAKAARLHTRTLSGTPILQGIEDLWSQYEIACPTQNITGFDNYYSFRNYYCVVEKVWGAANPNATKIVGYKQEDELRDLTRPYVTRVMSDEFRKGKKPTFMQVSCPMSADQAKAYNEMKTLLVSMLDTGAVTAKNALVGLQKLMQIASGFVYLSDDDMIRDRGDFEIIGTNKTDAVVTLLEGLDEPTLIWAPYRALQAMTSQVIKAEFQRVGGLRPRPLFVYEDRNSILKWQEQGGIMIANQGGGAGVGQNLQNSAANIYMTNTFSAEARWQSLYRTDRIGQTRQVRVWDLMTPDSTDYTALANLLRKENISKDNIDSLRRIIL